MTDRELFKMTLDALEKIAMGGDPRWANDVVPALRARLAQPEPTYQPMHPELRKMYEDYFDAAFRKLAPLPREWVGLTAKDLAEIPSSCYEGAIWADAKLKQKNT